MPPRARPPRIGSQRLPVAAGAACWPCCPDAVCCAGLAGVCAGGAVTLRCVPTLRPPPMRRASASGTTSAPPRRMMPAAINHFVMLRTSESTMLSKTHASMYRDHAGRKVKDFHLAESFLAQHGGEHGLVGMLADCVGERAVCVGVAGNLVPEPRQHLE